MTSVSYLHYKPLLEECQKLKTDIGLKLILLYTLLYIMNLTPHSVFKGTRFLCIHAPLTQNPHNPSFSRFESFQHGQTFYSKTEPLYATQCTEPFVFLLHTPMSLSYIQDSQISIQK